MSPHRSLITCTGNNSDDVVERPDRTLGDEISVCVRVGGRPMHLDMTFRQHFRQECST